jgi:prolipoprotein diacylglyceryltransferase
MWADLKNLFLAVLLIYGVTYAIGVVFALIKHRNLAAETVLNGSKKVNRLDKGLIVVFLLLFIIAFLK